MPENRKTVVCLRTNGRHGARAFRSLLAAGNEATQQTFVGATVQEADNAITIALLNRQRPLPFNQGGTFCYVFT